MKNKKIFSRKHQRMLSSFFYIMVFVSTLMLFSLPMVLAHPAVNLGTAGNFVILSKSGISTTGTTSIVGDIGVSPISSTAITGFGLIMDPSNKFSRSFRVAGKVYAANYASPTPSVMTTAVSDMQTAYTDAAGRTLPDHTELGSGNIDGMTLAPGLYKWGTGVTIPHGVTLDCQGDSNGVFIFQIAQTLTVGNGAVVSLKGGCQANNIFWQVGGQTTLGTTSVFNGNILDKTAIVLQTGARLNGRALAQTAVTLDASRVNAVSSPPGPPGPPVRVLTKITVSPKSANIALGSTLKLKADGRDQFGSHIAAAIVYASSNSSVATVDAASGLVTPVAYGTTTITASSGAVSGSSTITVPVPLPTIKIIGSVNHGSLVAFAISAKSPSGRPLTFDLPGKPSTATFIDNGDGTASFSWSPDATNAGVTNLNFSVSDGLNTASKSVKITVKCFPTTGRGFRASQFCYVSKISDLNNNRGQGNCWESQCNSNDCKFPNMVGLY